MVIVWDQDPVIMPMGAAQWAARKAMKETCATLVRIFVYFNCLLGSFNNIFFIILETGRTADNVLEIF